MTVDRKRLRELAMAATPGPWHAMEPLGRSHSDHGYRRIVDVVRERVTVYAEAAKMWRDASGYTWGDDAAFIAAADPQTILAMLHERDALAERADAAEAEVEALKHDIERHIAIASSEADYAEKLHKALHALTYSVGLIVDRWNVEHPNVPHPETKRVAAAREVLATPSAPKGPQQTTTGERHRVNATKRDILQTSPRNGAECAAAWYAWNETVDGRSCSDERTLGKQLQPYLGNRLWRAFIAGWNAATATKAGDSAPLVSNDGGLDAEDSGPMK